MAVHLPTFALVLRHYRMATGLTQDELALRANISVRTVSDLERGLSRYPHSDTVERLATALALNQADQEQLAIAAQRPPAARLQLLLPSSMRRGACIGREHELEQVPRLLQRSDVRLVTLLGPAGIGKTRLACEIALSLQDTWRDGAAFIALERLTTATLVMSEIAQQLGVREQAQQPILATLTIALATKEALLILDNFEQVTAAASEIALLLVACPQVTILITSQFALGILGEHQWSLAPLGVPQATNGTMEPLLHYPSVALFYQYLLTDSPAYRPTDPELAIIGQICRVVDGLPLAIQLAAGLYPRYSLAELLAQLQATPALPLATGNDPLERRRSVTQAIAWSYQLLDKETQASFRRLSVFAGGATRAAVFAIIDVPPAESLQALDTLIQQSLVTVVATTLQSRYSMLAPLQSFARRSLAASAEAAMITKRHADYFAEFVGQMGPLMNSTEQSLAIAQIQADHDNIRAALEWSVANDAAGIGVRMIGILWRFWHIHGYLTEGRTWTERILAVAATTSPTLVLGQAYYGASILANEQGDYTRAATLAQAALAVFRPLDNLLGIAAVQNLAGSIARYQGDWSRAAEYFSAAQSIYTTVNNAAGIALTLNNLGTIAVERGNYLDAQQYFERSLTIKRAGMDPRAIALTLNNLGDALHYQSFYTAAENCYRESETLFEQLGDRQGMSMTLLNQGDLLRYAHQWHAALDYYDRAYTAFDELGDRQGVAVLMLKRAHTLLGMSALTEVRPALMASIHVYGETHNEAQLADCFVVLALLCWEEGQSVASIQLLALSQQLRQQLGMLLVPAEQAIVARAMATMQLHFGAATYAAYWQAGTKLTSAAVLAKIIFSDGIATRLLQQISL